MVHPARSAETRSSAAQCSCNELSAQSRTKTPASSQLQQWNRNFSAVTDCTEGEELQWAHWGWYMLSYLHVTTLHPTRNFTQKNCLERRPKEQEAWRDRHCSYERRETGRQQQLPARILRPPQRPTAALDCEDSFARLKQRVSKWHSASVERFSDVVRHSVLHDTPPSAQVALSHHSRRDGVVHCIYLEVQCFMSNGDAFLVMIRLPPLQCLRLSYFSTSQEIHTCAVVSSLKPGMGVSNGLISAGL